jgi:hypothetical protein
VTEKNRLIGSGEGELGMLDERREVGENQPSSNPAKVEERSTSTSTRQEKREKNPMLQLIQLKRKSM